MAQWATFLRNHDELDLSRLTERATRRRVRRVRARDADMRLYDRGIRRRLAPMLGGDRRRIQLAYALQFAHARHAGAAVRRGDRHGREPALPGRDAIRTPMQWRRRPQGRLLHARRRRCPAGARHGRFGDRRVNVREQQRDPDSLLRWFQQLIRVLRECPGVRHRRVHGARRRPAAGRCWRTASTRRRVDAAAAQPGCRAGPGGHRQVRPSRGRPRSRCSPTGRTTRRVCSSRASSCGRGATAGCGCAAARRCSGCVHAAASSPSARTAGGESFAPSRWLTEQLLTRCAWPGPSIRGRTSWPSPAPATPTISWTTSLQAP